MSDHQSLDSICDEFEYAWKFSKFPRIEDFLNSVPPDERQLLLKALLEIEFELLLRGGQSPDLAAYQLRFPDNGSIIDDAIRVTQQRVSSLLPSQLNSPEPRPPKPSAEWPSADLNLLFGIQAWQSGLISEGQLLAAMQRWTFSKERPLGQILVETGALTESQRLLLDSMVETQVRLFRGDAGEALGSMKTPPEIATSLRQESQDESINASLDRLPTTLIPLHPNDIENQTAISNNRELESRYQFIKKHKRGGLGEVWKAKDLELNREIALKRMRPDAAKHITHRARFILEAEITGSLEHPGIVPVYGLGTDSEGLPFYAMRFVQGQDLSESVRQFHKQDLEGIDPRERSRELRRLLSQFVSVCKAVQYAHDRGVLHRDLKPANVMLGKYGETLVVDWGLAKAVGRADVAPEREFPADETTLRPAAAGDKPKSIVGTAFGTPQFMPPEQAAGRLDEISFHSNIYSLGATLYYIMTGTYAFDDQRTTIENHFPKPRDVKSAVPAELESICLKAMATHPRDRYASAMMLAQAIEDWLVDEPVSALRSIVVEFERLVRESPATAVVQEQLARSRTNLALVLTSLGRHKESVEAFEQVIADYSRLTETETDPRRFQAELATTRIHYSRVLLSINRDADAAEQQRLAVKEFDELLSGSSHEYRTNMASVFLTILPKADRLIPVQDESNNGVIKENSAGTASHDSVSPNDDKLATTVGSSADTPPISDPASGDPVDLNRYLSEAFDSGTAATEQTFILEKRGTTRRSLLGGDETSETTAGGKFTILHLIATGGMSTIYAAFDEDLKREVVIKEINASMSRELRMRDRFKCESQILAKLSHPNIMPILSIGYRSGDKMPFLVLPLIRGGTLAQAIASLHHSSLYETSNSIERFFSSQFWNELRPLLSKFAVICHAINYAHTQGIIHCDPKPANVLLGENGEVLLSDWGLAVSVSNRDFEVGIDDEIVIAGTPTYMSPEMAKGGIVGFHSDIYLLGATLFHLLTGQPPHQGGGVHEILAEIINSPSPEANSIKPGIPSALNAICSKAMSKDISERYLSASDLGRDLESWLSNATETTGRASSWKKRLSSFWQR